MIRTMLLGKRAPFNLEDFLECCPGNLVNGAVIVYNGKHWTAAKVCPCENGGSGQGWASSSEVAELKASIRDLQNRVHTLENKVRVFEENNQEATKFIDVEFNNETEKTVADPFVTAASIIDFVFLNGEPNGEVLTYADNGTVRVVSDKPETGVFRLQITKKK